jgi:hypothetical protein
MHREAARATDWPSDRQFEIHHFSVFKRIQDSEENPFRKGVRWSSEHDYDACTPYVLATTVLGVIQSQGCIICFQLRRRSGLALLRTP